MTEVSDPQAARNSQWRPTWRWYALHVAPLVVTLPLFLWPIPDEPAAARTLDRPVDTTSPDAEPKDGAVRQEVSIPALIDVPCRFNHDDSPEVDCYDAYLPNRRDEPTDGFVIIHVAVAAGSAEAPPDPVIYLHGGPAVPTMADFVSRLDEGFQQMYGGREVVVFDQRGSGLSWPSFECDLAGTYRQSLTEDLAESSLGWLARQTESCLPPDPEIDLSVFNAEEIAADAEDIASMLGYPSVNLFGSSFGSRVAITYAAQARTTQVRSVVLEGPYPPGTDGIARRGTAAMGVLKWLFAACAEADGCGAEYPDLETRLDELTARLATQPIVLNGGEVVNAHRFMEILFRTSYSHIGDVPALIGDTAGGNLDTLAAALETTADTTADIDPITFFATICSTTSSNTSAGLELTVRGLSPSIGAFFDEMGRSTLRMCELMDVTPAGVPGRPGATTVPILYLVGALDTVTPPQWARAAVGTWPGTVVEFAYASHGTVFEDPVCAGGIVAEFVATLVAPADACVSRALDFAATE